MKRITALLLTLILFTLNIFAANVSKDSNFWLAKLKNEAKENIDFPLKYLLYLRPAENDNFSKYFAKNINSALPRVKELYLDDVKYFAKHITHDAFYKKLCEGEKISKFTNDSKWDCIYEEISKFWEIGFAKIQYFNDTGETAVTYYENPLPLDDEWFAALDEALLSGELGKIKNVSFLSYDVDNRLDHRFDNRYMPSGPVPEIDESLWDNVTDEFYSAWFAYIESDTGEYLFPCVIDGNMGIESGKVYELYECAEIMNANIYVVEDFYAELVEDDTPNVWCFLAAFVIVLSGICIAVVLIRKAKKKKRA